jgi:hypothetical protein
MGDLNSGYCAATAESSIRVRLSFAEVWQSPAQNCGTTVNAAPRCHTRDPGHAQFRVSQPRT